MAAGRGIEVNPVTVDRMRAPAAVLLVAPAIAPTLTAAAAPRVTWDWRAVFGASAVRAVLARWPAVRLSSFLRTPERNRAVGGRPGSYHLNGLAGDFVVPARDRAAFLAWVRATWPRGVDVIDEGDHVHVEWTQVAVTPLARVLLVVGGAAALAFLSDVL